VGVHEDKVRITAENNDYDEAFVTLRGSSFTSNVTFENLPSLSSLLTPAALSSALEATLSFNAHHILTQKGQVQVIPPPNPADKKAPPVKTGTGQLPSVEKLVADSLAAFQLGNNVNQVVTSVLDVLSFGDVTGGETKKIVFSIRNTTNYIFRYHWDATGDSGTPEQESGERSTTPSGERVVPCLKDFSITPSVGYLNPLAIKNVTITYTPTQQLNLVYPIACHLDQIKYDESVCVGGVLPEWDNSMHVKKKVGKETIDELKPEPPHVVEIPSRSSAQGQPVAVVQSSTVAQKATTKAQGTSSSTPSTSTSTEKVSSLPPAYLLVQSLYDFNRYEINTQELKFHETMMFQSRTHSFQLRNVGLMTLDFKAFIHLLPNEGGKQSIHNSYVSDDDSPPLGPLDTDPLAPFSIRPVSGTIVPGEMTELQVSFKPFDALAFTRELWFLIPNRAPGQILPKVSLFGAASRPLCHLELEANNYLESRRDDVLNMQHPIDKNTQVLEFVVRGTNQRVTRKFMVLNPSAMGWDFVIDCVTPYISLSPVNTTSSSPPRPFNCLTRKGTVLPGMSSEIVFEFTSISLDITESLWNFKIPSADKVQRLLLVGTTEEPEINISPHFINFGARLLDRPTDEIIRVINTEDSPFTFTFDDSQARTATEVFTKTVLSSDIKTKARKDGSEQTSTNREHEATTSRILSIAPLSASVPAKSEVEVKVRFVPFEEKFYNFNIPCVISRKAQKLNLNVKGEGYLIKEKLTLDSGDIGVTASSLLLIPSPPTKSSLVQTSFSVATVSASAQSSQTSGLVSPLTGRADRTLPYVVAFGPLQIKDSRSKKLTLSNVGAYPLDYSCELIRSSLIEGASTTDVSPVNAQLQHGSITGRSKIEREITLWDKVRTSFQFIPNQGTVGRQEQTQIELRFRPLQTLSVQSLVATVSITNGPTYYFNISGGGYRPVLKFDWLEHNFGQSFLIFGSSSSTSQNYQKLLSAQLTVTNEESFDVRFDCLGLFVLFYFFLFVFSYEPLFMGDNSLESDVSSSLLNPGQSHTINFTFTPRECKKYEWKLPFEINGLFTVTVVLRGEGVPLRLDVLKEGSVIPARQFPNPIPPCENIPNLSLVSQQLADLLGDTQGLSSSYITMATRGGAQDSQSFQVTSILNTLESNKRCDFGRLRVGQRSGRTIKIMNYSVISLRFSLIRAIRAMRDLNIYLTSTSVLEHTLEPRQVLELRFTYEPEKRCRTFSIPLVVDTATGPIALVSFVGACVGLEVKLDTGVLFFS
jgi:hypothetical protein